MEGFVTFLANILNHYNPIFDHGRVIRLENKKVLIVDDQNGIRILLVEVFSVEGYDTFQASNGKIALEIVHKEKPDLVLLDMKIPGMDGLEILKHIKQIDESIKVIMMTAYGELDMIKEASDLGALMHFTKPFDIDELRIAVNNELSNSSSSGYAMGS
jgi:two-component system response regulator (stage 0 sporulation protein F)